MRKKKSKRGRPYAITKTKEDKLIELMSDGLSQAKACRVVGISQETICKHKKRFPGFVKRLERSMLETDRIAYRSLKVGMTRDWRACAWWLERRHPERFGLNRGNDTADPPNLVEGCEWDNK